MAANLGILRKRNSLRIDMVLCYRKPLSSLLVLINPGELLRKLFHTPIADIQTLKQVEARKRWRGGTPQK